MDATFNKAQWIIDLLRLEVARTEKLHLEARASYAGTEAASSVWMSHNSEDGIGGISQNPYNVPQARERAQKAALQADQARQAYDFAVDTFLSKRPDG